MTIPKSAFLAATAVLLTQSAFADEQTAAPAPAPADEKVAAPADENAGIAVIIDNTIKIPIAEIDKGVEMIMRNYAMQMPPEQLMSMRPMFRNNVKQQLIQHKILIREAEKAGVKAPTEEERNKFFADNTQGMTTIEAEAVRSGMNMKEFTELLDSAIRIQRLIESKTASLPAVTEADAKTRFDEIVAENPEAVQVPENVEASHILILVDYDDVTDEAEKTKIKDEAKAKIDGIRAKALLENADFAKLAEEFSECPSGKRSGGSLGSFGRGQMVPEFEKAAFAQKIGEIGPVIETQFGYHIVRTDSRTEAKTIEFDEVKQNIIEGLANEAKQKTFGEFFRGVIENVKIDDLEETVYSDVVQIPHTHGEDCDHEPPPSPPESKPESKSENENRPLPAWAQ